MITECPVKIIKYSLKNSSPVLGHIPLENEKCMTFSIFIIGNIFTINKSVTHAKKESEFKKKSFFYCLQKSLNIVKTLF